jgi:hypothetical protein
MFFTLLGQLSKSSSLLNCASRPFFSRLAA